MDKLFHGSNVIVEHPDIRIRGYEKDFGYGFYCTAIESQAKKWALSKKGNHVVNIYEFEGYNGYKTKVFSEMTEEWLDFVIDCAVEDDMTTTLWKDRWQTTRYGTT